MKMIASQILTVSLGCIYIVRDPRNVITSYKNFENREYKANFRIL